MAHNGNPNIDISLHTHSHSPNGKMHENAQKSVCLKIAQHAISRTHHISQTIISIFGGLKATQKKGLRKKQKSIW